VFDPKIWLGSYSARGCDSSQCCCAASIFIAETTGKSTYLITASGFTGDCPAEAASFISVTTLLPRSNNITYTLVNQRHSAFMNAESISVTDRNNDAPACSATLTKQKYALNSAAAVPQPTTCMVLAALAATVAAIRIC
jgi:hypothetical protein